MNRRSRGLPLLVLLAVAGCGGGVGNIGPQEGDGGPGGNPVGDDAEIAYDDGSVLHRRIDPRCASGSPVGTGQACEAAGLICPLGTLTDCNGAVRTLECTCDGRLWSCDPVTSMQCEQPPPPPLGCPDPSTLLPGSPCDLPENQQCVSTDIPGPFCPNGPPPITKAVCQCVAGAWSCPMSTAPCMVPPPPSNGCPDPSSVYAGETCSSAPGLSCSGNPSPCGGAIFYDALACVSGSWVSVATTVCEIGGDIDAGPPEGGAFFGD